VPRGQPIVNFCWVVHVGRSSQVHVVGPIEHEELVAQGYRPYRMVWSVVSNQREDLTVYIAPGIAPTRGVFSQAADGLQLLPGPGTLRFYDPDSTSFTPSAD
jgi:hypothetical protein